MHNTTVCKDTGPLVLSAVLPKHPWRLGTLNPKPWGPNCHFDQGSKLERQSGNWVYGLGFRVKALKARGPDSKDHHETQNLMRTQVCGVAEVLATFLGTLDMS